MKVEDLHELFEKNPENSGFDFEGKCKDCGAEVKISVDATPEGFQITGNGALYRFEDNYFLKCTKCFEADPILRNFREIEVYSRVVGYLRPVKQWNPGKQAEFKKRKMFATGEDYV